MRRCPIDARFAINGSLPQNRRTARRPQSRLGINKAPPPPTPENHVTSGRSDPLIANTSVEHAQVPDQRAGSRSMDRSHKTGAPLDARRAGSVNKAPPPPTPENHVTSGRSDPLIANTSVEHAQVPDQRPHRDQWIAPRKNRQTRSTPLKPPSSRTHICNKRFPPIADSPRSTVSPPRTPARPHDSL
jgi:hypothetical protein